MNYLERESHYRILREQQLFQGVSLDAVECCFDRFGERVVDSDVVLLRRDRVNHTLYLLVEGEVNVFLDDTGQVPLRTLGPGECFGEMSLIDDGLVSATVISAGECRCITVDQDTLWEMVHRSHTLARNLLFILSGRVRSSNESIAANLQQLERMESFALTDALTGLHNRRWLDESLGDLFQQARTARQPLTAMMLDVDRFKPYNDRWGHIGGDQALRTVARVVAGRLRPHDMVARYGGEEFVILLPSTDPDAGARVAERIRAAVASASPTGTDGRALPPVTVSIGIASLDLDAPDDSLLARIDAALYEAKESGRNRVVRVGC